MTDIIRAGEYVWFVPSSTTDGVWYKVDAHQGGTCSCQAGQHLRNCRHVATILEMLRAETIANRSDKSAAQVLAGLPR